MTRLLFRLHPVIYWIAGLLMIALAAIVYLSMLEDNARHFAEALAGDPPAAVRLEDFDKAVHANAAKEVVILAAVETAAMYTMSRETFGVEIKRWVAPLRPAASGLDATEIRAALFERDGAAPAETLSRWFVAENEGRPVARLHGVLKTVSGGRRQADRGGLRRARADTGGRRDLHRPVPQSLGGANWRPRMRRASPPSSPARAAS